MKIPGFNRDKTRMLQWLMLSLMAYAVAAFLASLTDSGDSGLWPRVQTVLWKCGHLNLAAFIGYWVDRNSFATLRITLTSHPLEQVRRAIIIAATMIAFGLAL